jgi:hypothetical protein
MLIDIVHTCDNCVHNGYRIDDEQLENLNIEERGRYYDEDLRKKASEDLGMDIRRDEAEDDGECKMGTNWNAGCSLYTCSECGEVVNHVVFVDGC